MRLTVVKLGGSLMDSGELARWLAVIRDHAVNSTVLIVPGGGRFTELVRDVDARYQLQALNAHRMALLGMAQFGYFLLDRLPGSVTTTAIHRDRIPRQTTPVVWLPDALMHSDALEWSWDVSSDTIALWLSTHLHAERLCLVKPTNDIAGNPDLNLLVKKQVIDNKFQSLIELYSGKICFYNRQDSASFP